MTQAWHDRIGKLHLSHLRFVFPTRFFPTYPSVTINSDGLRRLTTKDLSTSEVPRACRLNPNRLYSKRASLTNLYNHQHGSRPETATPAAMI